MYQNCSFFNRLIFSRLSLPSPLLFKIQSKSQTGQVKFRILIWMVFSSSCRTDKSTDIFLTTAFIPVLTTSPLPTRQIPNCGF